MINNNILLYFRKDRSTLFVLSAATLLLLLLTTTPILFNVIPVQAQTPMTFRTLSPATGSADLTFDAHGTTTPSGPYSAQITNGTIQLKAGHQIYTGEITSGSFTNDSRGGSFTFYAKIDNVYYSANSLCSTSQTNSITLSNSLGRQSYEGPVECTSSQGERGNTTTADATMQPSSSMTTGAATITTTQDRDRDGIPDANDNCPNLPNARCYKEGDTALVVHNSNR
ncbi:MAG: thrombospondin type 3 repeat-containing protein [Nitrososphaera sp.]